MGVYTLTGNSTNYTLQKNKSYIYSPVGNNLPMEYQELDYIESTGTQYINLNYTETNLTTVDAHFYTVSAVSNYLYGGSQYGSMMYNGLYNNNTLEYNYKSIKYTASNDIVMTQTVVDDGINISININNSSYTAVTGNSNKTNMYIFACNSGGRLYGNLRCYYFILKDNNSIVKHLIPCLRKFDSKPGIYDMVNDVFYVNAGTGNDFTYGSILPYKIVKFVPYIINRSSRLPVEYHELDYLQSTGEQYINTGVLPSSDLHIISTIASVDGTTGLGYTGWNGSGYTSMLWGYGSDNYQYKYRTSYVYVNTSVILDDEFHIFDLQSGEQTFDGHQYSEDVITPNPIYNLCLFGFSLDTEGGRIYYNQTKHKDLVIYRSGVKILHLVPCYRIVDNKSGMYDLIKDIFYTNANITASTDFIIGNVVDKLIQKI